MEKFIHLMEKLCIALLIMAYLTAGKLIKISYPNKPSAQIKGSEEAEEACIYSPSQKRVLWLLSRGIPRIADKLPFHCNCVIRAYACAKILQIYKIPYTFCVGADYRGDAGTQGAHAWVECQKRVIVGGSDCRTIYWVFPFSYVWGPSYQSSAITFYPTTAPEGIVVE